MSENTMPEVVAYDPLNWSGIKVPKFRDPERCWKFMKKYGFSRLPEQIERVFLKDLSLAIQYAQRIHSRLPKEFEDQIKKSPELTWDYICKVIKVPCEEFENSIAERPMVLVEYSRNIVQGRLAEHLENRLVGDPYACFEYAWQVLDGRLPENLHNFMFGAVMDSNFSRKYRGYKSKLHDGDEFSPDYVTPSTYFEFIKFQRKNLCRQIKHYSECYGIDDTRSVSDLLHELEHGR